MANILFNIYRWWYQNAIFEGVVDEYKSFIWTTRYYTHGDFEIVAGLNTTTFSLLQVGNYVERNDMPNEWGIIERIEINISEDGEELITATGRLMTQLIARRIIAKQTVLNCTVTEAIETLINNEILNPELAARKMDNFVFNNYDCTDTIRAQYTGKNLYDVISAICQDYGLGNKVTGTKDNIFTFTLYKGVDRSYAQSENPYVVFSDKYDNLINATYINTVENRATSVLVAGEGEGLDRTTVWVDNPSNYRGMFRYEMYDDSRNMSSNNGEISQADYIAQLTEAGKESLTLFEKTFSGEAYFDSYKYRTDVNLGDIVTIENTKIGSYINARIIEVIESVDESGAYSIIPTFGN